MNSKRFTLLPFLLILLGSSLTHLFGQVSYNVTFQHDGKTVYGTFSAPGTSGKYLTVIICPGSGQDDRNLTLPLTDTGYLCFYPELYGKTLRPYKELADSLVGAGFAVLRYDKLEYTYTPSSLGAITFHKLFLPFESAIKYVKTRSDVDTNRIVLLGHSEGSSLISYVAKSRSDIKALISVGGPRSTFDTLFADQIIRFAKLCNGDTITAKQQADQILLYYYIVRNHLWNVNTPALFGVPPAEWYNYLLATDPVVENYNQDSLPTLFLGMERDINVPISELHMFENEVNITNDFWSIPNAIHFLTPYDMPHISNLLTDTIIYWLKENVLTNSTEIFEKSKVIAYAYPNPFKSEFKINLAENENAIETIYVVSASGGKYELSKSAWSRAESYLTIDLTSYPAGLYFIQIQLKNNSIYSKIVKSQ